jgi:hypothetical protein
MEAGDDCEMSESAVRMNPAWVTAAATSSSISEAGISEAGPPVHLVSVAGNLEIVRHPGSDVWMSPSMPLVTARNLLW